MKSFPLLLLSACLLAGCASSLSEPGAQASAVHTDTASAGVTAKDAAPGVVYDTDMPAGVVKAIGQNVRVGTPSTSVTLSAKVSSDTPMNADVAVLAVRREGSENLDIGHVNNYTIGTQEQTFTASGKFAPGHYMFWFAYLKDGVWHEGVKRAFTIAAADADVPLDPVDASEPGADLLRFIGTDKRQAFENEAVRLDAKLSSPVPINIDQTQMDGEIKPQLEFMIRDASGGNFDRVTHLKIPAQIGQNTELSANAYFPAGTYRYKVTYHQGGAWHDLGAERTFVVLPAPTVPVPGAGNAAWQENHAAWDDFNGSLSQWTPFPKVGYDNSCLPQNPCLTGFSAGNAQVEGGELLLTAKKEPTSTSAGVLPYSLGAVQSNFDIPPQPSYVEVRAKVLAKSANVLSAIWLQTFPTVEALNPNPEIDMQETFDYGALTSTLHTWKWHGGEMTEHDQVTSNSFHTHVTDTSAAYHTYGLERRDGWMRFYFDGKLAWAVKPNVAEMTTMPRRLVLSLEGHLKQPNDAELAKSGNNVFRIDYVHTYSYKGS